MFDNIKIQFIREMKKNKLTQFAIFMLLFLVILAILAPYICKDPNTIDVRNRNVLPNSNYLFGTDDLGRDYFSRALHGGRVSLLVGSVSVIISVFIGTIVGVITGYFGGWVDQILMRFIDIIMSIPNFFLIVILNTYLKPGLQNVILILGLLSWMGLARLIRSEILSLKSRDYIQYAQAIGSSNLFIIVRHLVIRLIPIIIVWATLNVGSAILTESSLSFFGLGVSQPNSSWGNMLSDARSAILKSPHLGIIPGVLIFMTVLSFNLLGESLRKAMELQRVEQEDQR